MVDERTAYWGDRDAARYRTRDDDPTGGDYVVAETLDANGDPVDVLLRWDDTAGEWVSGGPVNMNGSDVTNVGALDADSVSTDDATIGNPGIKFTENGPISVTVPGDYATVNDALEDLKGFVARYKLDITVTSDTNEDVYVEPTVLRRIPQGEPSETTHIRIKGDGTFPAVNSVFIDCTSGMGISVEGLTVAGANPFSDENASVEAYGSRGRVGVGPLTFTGSNGKGVIAYASDITIGGDLDFTGSTIGGFISTKHSGKIMVSGEITGSANSYVAEADSGRIEFNNDNLPVSASGPYNQLKNGVVSAEYVIGGGPNLQRRVTQTITSGAIDLTSQYIRVKGEGDANDTLETLNGGQEGVKAVLTGSGLNTVTVSHNTGNIKLDGQTDKVIDSRHDHLVLIQDATGFWSQVSYASGG